jgi:hypothetical protein
MTSSPDEVNYQFRFGIEIRFNASGIISTKPVLPAQRDCGYGRRHHWGDGDRNDSPPLHLLISLRARQLTKKRDEFSIWTAARRLSRTLYPAVRV